MPKVVILLATFNGSRNLEEQLTSLKNQNGVTIQVMVNDDGSTDETLDILSHWQAQGLITSLSTSERIGPTASFLKLLRNSEGAPLVAFCDQDDVWDLEKILKLSNIMDYSQPCAIFSRRHFIDARGNLKFNKVEALNVEPSFLNAIVENIIPGNTVMLNSHAVEIINSTVQDKVIHYDWWIYLLVSAFGVCKLVPERLICYRIHDRNFIGLGKLSFSRGIKSVEHSLLQAHNFKDQFSSRLNLENEFHISLYASLLSEKNIFSKLWIAATIPIRRQKLSDSLIYRMLLISWVFMHSSKSYNKLSK